MKVYYKEDDIYPATYNFKDEEVGATETDIEFVDYSDEDTNTSVYISASLDGHSKILGFYDNDAAGKCFIYHDYDAQTYGTIEFWIRSSDPSKYFQVNISNGGTAILRLRIDGGNFQTNDGGGGFGNIVACSSGIWYHIRIDFECTAAGYNGLAQYDYHIYIDGIHYGDYDFENNEDSANRSYIRTTDADSGYYGYIDAWGESWDTNYNIGDNRTDDYHYYNRTQLTDIIEYPNIICRNNMYGSCSIKVRDFEGALYDTWYDMDFTEFIIEDNDENKIFRGYLINKKFSEKQLILILAGIGIKLEWTPFYKNYILEEGKVRAPINASSVVDCYDDIDGDGVDDGAGEDFAWTVDGWHTDQDVGLLLTDTTKTIDSKTWTCTAIATVNGNNTGGNAASLAAANDGDTYDVNDSGTSWDAYITPTISGSGGDEIATVKILDHITINYNIKYKHIIPAVDIGAFILKIRNSDNDWTILSTKYVIGTIGYHMTWSDSFDLVLSSSELAKFLVVDGANWDDILEIRLEFIYSGEESATAYIKFDYLDVEIYYEAYAFAPIMEPITDNTASTLTCSGIADWQVTGLSVNDDFKIGQNTAQIVADIGTESNIPIIIIGQETTGGGTQVLRPDGDDTTEWQAHSDSGGDGSHFKDIDEVVVDPAAGDGNWVRASGTDSLTEIFDMETVVMGGNNVGTKIEMHVYYMSTLQQSFNVNIYTTSTGWIEEKYASVAAGWHWKTFTWENLTLSQADIDSLQIKFRTIQPLAAGNFAYVDTAYVVLTYGIYNPFTKFIARKFRGTHCIDALKAVCELEGAIWCEDYVNNRIKVLEPDNYECSDIELTEDDYDYDWEYEDLCNQFKRVDVFGSVDNVDYPIHEYSEDNSIAGFKSYQIINERIMTAGDAKEIADAQLALLRTKRPSLKLILHGTNEQLQLGTTVNITLVRPTVAAADYPIRMIERSKRGIDDIKTIIYCGLGESPIAEEIGMTIRKIGYIANRAMSDRLI